MNNLFKSIKNKFAIYIGLDDSYPIEQRFFNLVSSFGGIISILGTLVNILIDAELILTMSTVVALVICWTSFYMSRFAKKFVLAKWILTAFLFVLVGYVFLINNGSRGPVLYLYMVFFILLLIVWNGAERRFFIVLFVINIVVYLVLEYHFPSITKIYESERLRLLDVYFSYFMYILLVGLIMMFTFKEYIKEKNKAEQSDQLKTAFLANMSHEIRTPMNAILGFTQLLHNSNLTEEKKEIYLKVINENGHSLLRLIDDIIDVSKIEAGELEINQGDVHIGKLMNELIASFKSIISNIPDKNLELHAEYGLEGQVIRTDQSRLKQILSNLMHNAIKYTDDGKIILGCSIEGEFVKFYVRDTGEGIRDEHLKEIFERFRKIESEGSKKIQPGTGIGLSISKHLCELLGGDMGVQSEYGKGSEFFFTLPFIPVRIEKFAEVLKKEVPDFNEFDFSGKTILVAEDENANFYFLKKVLERTNVEILRARNGREAVDMYRVHPEIDCILMDILMPEMNGFQATEIIKSINRTIPIIAQTALAMEGDARDVMNAGCDDYVSKPIRVSILMEKIKKFIPDEQLN